MERVERERRIILVGLCCSVCVAPFFLRIWTAFLVGTMVLLQLWRLKFPETKCSVIVEVPKKRVKIKEDENMYIEDRNMEQPTVSSQSLPTILEEVQLELHERVHKDVCVKVVGLRIAGAGCNGAGEAEYKLQVTTRDGYRWSVWRNYREILQVHGLLEQCLDNIKTRQSLLTRIVPPIPSQQNGIVAVLFESRRSIMARRRTALECFIDRVLGDQTDLRLRQVALRLPQVRAFLDLAPLMTRTHSNLTKSSVKWRFNRRFRGRLRRKSDASESSSAEYSA